MRKRIPPSERTGERLRRLLNEGTAADEGRPLKSAFVQLAVHKVIEELLASLETLAGACHVVLSGGLVERDRVACRPTPGHGTSSKSVGTSVVPRLPSRMTAG